MLPLVGRMAPETTLKRVVLPAPFGPMIPVMWPGSMSRVQWSKARTPPKSFTRSRTCRMGVGTATALPSFFSVWSLANSNIRSIDSVDCDVVCVADAWMRGSFGLTPLSVRTHNPILIRRILYCRTLSRRGRSSTMNITVYGAGAIGGIAGAKVALAGHDVTFVDKVPEHVDLINRQGLLVTGVSEERVRAPASAARAVGGPSGDGVSLHQGAGYGCVHGGADASHRSGYDGGVAAERSERRTDCEHDRRALFRSRPARTTTDSALIPPSARPISTITAPSAYP